MIAIVQLAFPLSAAVVVIIVVVTIIAGEVPKLYLVLIPHPLLSQPPSFLIQIRLQQTTTISKIVVLPAIPKIAVLPLPVILILVLLARETIKKERNIRAKEEIEKSERVKPPCVTVRVPIAAVIATRVRRRRLRSGRDERRSLEPNTKRAKLSFNSYSNN